MRIAETKANTIRGGTPMATSSTALSYGVETTAVPNGAVVLLGRFLFVLIFLTAAPNHFTKQAIGYAASQGVPLASIAVPLSGITHSPAP
jgi:hypothetical protein